MRRATHAVWAVLTLSAVSGRDYAGQVVAPDGRPVAEARVVVVPPSGQDAILTETHSADDGSFTLAMPDRDEPRVRFGIAVVISPDWAIAARRLDELAERSTIRLEAGQALAVEVEGPDGQPAEGIPMRIAFVSRNPQGEESRLLLPLVAGVDPVFAATSDEQGRATFQRLPAGSQVRVTTDVERYAELQDWLTVGAPAAALRLRMAGSITGQVTYPDGQPASGALVGWTDRGNDVRQSATCDAEGRYHLDRLPPGVGILVSVPPADRADEFATAARTAVEIAEYDPQAVVDFQLQPGVPLTVSVVDDATGQPAKDVWVVVNGPQWPFGASQPQPQRGLMGPDGKVTIRVLPGDQLVMWGATSQDSPYERQAYPPPTVTVMEGQPASVELRAKPRPKLPPYRGLVVDEQGQPVPGATIVMDEQVDSFFPIDTDLTTDAAGRFELPNHGSKQALLSARKDDAATVSPVTAAPDTDVTLTLQANARARVTATVTAADGLPLAGARVSLMRWQSGYGAEEVSALTDAAGAVSLPAWPHDKYSLRVSRVGYGEVYSDEFAVRPGDQLLEGPFELAKADAFMAGWVIGPDGQPMAGIMVQLNGAPHGFRQTTTNAQGEWRFDGVVAAEAQVMAYSNDHQYQAFATAKPNDENTIITMKQRE